jgi:hypothetical protein
VYIIPKDSNVSKVIGLMQDKLYSLRFNIDQELVRSTCDLENLCHRRMDHLHHGALKVLKEILTILLYFNTKNHEVCKQCATGKYTKTNF